MYIGIENGESSRTSFERALWEIVYLQLQLNRLGDFLINYSTMPMHITIRQIVMYKIQHIFIWLIVEYMACIPYDVEVQRIYWENRDYIIIII